MKKDFDLLVLGGGSGGIAVAEKAAAYGKKVALIEMNIIGGTCVNVGCVPKKIMWYAGQLAESYHQGADYGFQCDESSFDFKKLILHRRRYIKHLNQIYTDRLKKNNIRYIQGQGEFVDSHTVRVGPNCYTARHIVIATGAESIPPAIKGAEFVMDSNKFFDLTQLPKKIAIVGGGYIGVEFASILNQLGVEIQFLLRKDKPLRQFDDMLSNALVDTMEKQGIQLLPYHEVTEVMRNSSGQLTLYCKNKKTVSPVDAVIFAIGRRPRTESLNLEVVKIKTDKKGFVKTDKGEATNVPNIYAIGDVAGKKLLTPVAVAAGRCLAARIFGKEKKSYMDYKTIPTVVFSHPPVGSVGLTEQAAIDKYGKSNLSIYQKKFNSLFYALSDDKIPSQMKLITLKKTGKVIGCHLIGLGVDEILQGFALAIKMGATKNDFDNIVGIHPTSAEELHFV